MAYLIKIEVLGGDLKMSSKLEPYVGIGVWAADFVVCFIVDKALGKGERSAYRLFNASI